LKLELVCVGKSNLKVELSTRHRFPPSEEMMKKRTVITTEKREVWVISQPSDETAGRADKQRESDRDAGLLPAFRDLKPDENAADDREK